MKDIFLIFYIIFFICDIVIWLFFRYELLKVIILKIRGVKVTAEIIDISIPHKGTADAIKKMPGLKYRLLNRTTIILTVRFSLDGKRYRSKLRLYPLVSNTYANDISDGVGYIGNYHRHDYYYDNDAKQRAELEVGNKIDIIVDKKKKRRVALDRKVPRQIKRTNILAFFAFLGFMLVLGALILIGTKGSKEDNNDHSVIQIPPQQEESSSIPDEYKKGIELWNERERQQNKNRR